MITAYIGTQQLDLPIEFEFDLVKSSQIFSFDKLKGDFVPSIEFPDTEKNRNILNHPNRFELRRTQLKIYECFELRSDGFLLIRGTLVLEDQFSGYVRSSIGNIKASQEGKFITDIELLTDQTFNNKTEYDSETDNYCAPLIYNDNFFDGITSIQEFEGYEESILQHYHRPMLYAVNRRSLIDGLVTIPSDNLTLINLPEDTYTGNTQVVTPMLFLFPAIDLIMKSLHFYRTASQITDEELLSICIYNNKSIIDLDHVISYTKETVYGRGGKKEVINALSYLQQSLSIFNFADLLPRMTLKDFILQIQNLLNIVFVFEDEFHYRIVDREGVMTGAIYDIDDYLSGRILMKGKSDSQIKFIMNMDSNDALISTYYQDLSERQNDFGADLQTFDELWSIASPQLGELRRVIEENSIYEYGITTRKDENENELNVTTWYFVSIDFQPYIYNEGEDKTDTLEIQACGTLPYKERGRVQQQGRCTMRKDTEAGFSLRLLFNDADNYGSNYSTNYFLNFNPAYTNNLFEKRWKRTAAWLATREEIEGYALFPANILSNIDLNKKHRTRFGVYIPDKFTTKISHAGVGLTKITGWKY